MAIPEERLPGLLAYCHISDPDADDLLTIEILYDSAVGYLTEAGVSQPEDGTTRRAQYDLLVHAMVLDGFDQRGAQSAAGTLTENPSFRRVMNQLRLSEPPVSNLDTVLT